ncbi:histidine kinase [Halarcobacter ebronensis]|uniref:histidine kinase n=1 Tax=Halarcobacter ebronensis TaxID=1462615 RepID=A0A4Q0YII0_9BACT|nr:cache domain-containing protein [Halarcobacter ebronensis]RXJ70153.1 histidine kinase [Halarcobacter ebronensis]
MNIKTKNERTLVNIIKFGAVIPILLLSVIFTYIFIQYKNEELKKEIEFIKTRYMNQNKKSVQDEVNRVIKTINYEIEINNEELKQSLKNRVYEAYAIAHTIYKDNIKYKSKDEVFQIIKQALVNIRFNDGRGYIFIDDINGIKLLQPLNKSFEGRDFSNFEDPKGYKFVQKIIETIKDKSESFDQYYWYKSKEDKTAYEKLSFYKYFEPYNVAIGTGEYIDEYTQKLQNSIIEKIKRIKFDDNGYIMVFDREGKYLSHFQENKIGIDGFEVKDKNGKYFVKDMVNFAKINGEGFFSYIASAKPNGGNKNREKISFLKYFNDWGWTVGAGFYLEELNHEITQKQQELTQKYELIIKKIIFISILVTILLVLFSFYISKIIYNKFNEYKNEIKKEVDKTIENEKMLIQQSKMAIMGEMIGSVAHQLKQPLTLISTSNSLVKLNREIENFSTPEQIDDALENIDSSVVNLAATIDNFKNFFNPNKVKSVFKIEDLFNKTFILLDYQLKTNRIEVIKEINNLEFYGYENELLQVLINIIKNAIDVLVKKDENRIIFIEAKYKNDEITIKVKDNAGGVSPEILDKLFLSYVKTEKNEDTKGVNLYMTKQIISSIKGEISVCNVEYEYKDQKCKGAEFTIKIPFQSSL